MLMHKRLRLIAALLLVFAVVLAGRLAWVQVVWGPDLSARAEDQRARIYVDPARRGAVLDREGKQIAYTMQARSLTVSPTTLRKELREQAQLESDERLDDKQKDEYVRTTLREMSREIPKIIEEASDDEQDLKSKDLLDKLNADTQYEVLVRNVDPDVAAEISERFHGVAADHQDIRQYPNGAIGENVVGRVSMDGTGQFGLEASRDSKLSGINGRSTEDVSTNGQVIPGTLRDETPAVDGKDIELTLDLDLQTYVQQQLEQAKRNSLAESAEAVVLDATTGEVLAMANTDTIDPNGDIGKQLEEGKHFDNRSISFPYEPGSVAKIITAAAAIEEGLTTPVEVHTVPGSIQVADVTVNDAWPHGPLPYTTAGIFGKSSNVGTLQLAERLGQDKFDEYLNKFGIGETTGIELPNESSGLRPPRSQWSGSTFANLPIGQGMSWTTLQMASVFQTLANGGERVEPRIIKSDRDDKNASDKDNNDDGAGSAGTAADGNGGNDGNGANDKKTDASTSDDKPEKTRVVSKETAEAVVDMFRATVQADPAGVNNGTAPDANIEGYNISAKTGTAQKVDPNTGAYSNSAYWITFAGIAPVDDPRFVVAIMLDEPERGVLEGGGGGASAGPLFHQIASWLLDRDNVPPSPAAPDLTLQAP